MSAYCEPSDIGRYGVNAAAIDAVSDADKIMPAIEAQAGVIDSYIGKDAEGVGRYWLPLVDPGPAIRRANAILAAWDLIRVRGIKPGANPEDDALSQEVDRVLAWLKLVAAGTVTPPGIVDSPPPPVPGAVFEGAGVITSNVQRGFFSTDRWGSLPFQGRRQ